MKNCISLGVCYYPEHWQEADWETDLIVWNKGDFLHTDGHAACLAYNKISGSAEYDKGWRCFPTWLPPSL